MAKKVLVVDDEKLLVKGIKFNLENEGYEVECAYDGAAAVELARHNARLAEVDDIISFEVSDATRFHFGGLRGRIVTNPPYGERIMERKEAEDLYRAFGRAMRDMPPKWRILVLSSHTEFERTFGRTADKKRKLYNGMLKCDAYMFGFSK